MLCTPSKEISSVTHNEPLLPVTSAEAMRVANAGADEMRAEKSMVVVVGRKVATRHVWRLAQI